MIESPTALIHLHDGCYQIRDSGIGDRGLGIRLDEPREVGREARGPNQFFHYLTMERVGGDPGAVARFYPELEMFPYAVVQTADNILIRIATAMQHFPFRVFTPIGFASDLLPLIQGDTDAAFNNAVLKIHAEWFVSPAIWFKPVSGPPLADVENLLASIGRVPPQREAHTAAGWHPGDPRQLELMLANTRYVHRILPALLRKIR